MDIKYSPDWNNLCKIINKRIEKEKQIKNEGENKFQQLEGRLTDMNSDKLTEDIVIYAIRTIDNTSEAKDFIQGYISDIEKNTSKYPKQAKSNPLKYAKKDIYLALNLHFASNKTHQMWNSAIKNY